MLNFLKRRASDPGTMLLESIDCLSSTEGREFVCSLSILMSAFEKRFGSLETFSAKNAQERAAYLGSLRASAEHISRTAPDKAPYQLALEVMAFYIEVCSMSGSYADETTAATIRQHARRGNLLRRAGSR